MNLKTELYDHQKAAVNKLLPSRVGALFMEMGTGKSRTAIEIVHRRINKIWNVLWFCPAALKQTVKHQIITHTDCAEDDIHVFNEKTNEESLPECFWYVIGIESIASSQRVALTVNKMIDHFSMVIVDESSYIKGHRSKRAQRLTYFAERARYRMILTGTPISQGIVDLYSQMRFLSPLILGYRSFYSFAANHLEYSEKYPGMIIRSHNVKHIAEKIKPYVYQVCKEECLDLPDKIYSSKWFSMSNEQYNAYQMAKDEILMIIDSDNNNDIHLESYAIFRLFTALQQITCGFWNRYNEGGQLIEKLEFEHSRVEVLMKTIAGIPENEKIIIWVKYSHDIKIIGEALTEIYGDNSIAYFHGALSEKRRGSELAKFRSSGKIFLATMSCGGHGLTLNEAHYVIFYNNVFKYSERIQAEDRCHRIGQTHKVVYIDIGCYNSIDERIWNALIKKENVVDVFKKRVDMIRNEKGDVKKLIEKL